MQDPLDITIPNLYIRQILKSRSIDRERLSSHFQVNDPEIRLFKETTAPGVRVNFFRLEPTDAALRDSELLSVPVNEDSRIDLVIPSRTGKPRDFAMVPVKSCPLWDLSRFDKVDLLRCGRFKKNDFHPIIRENPIEMDLGVSREHSLICLYDSQMHYIDYGTSVSHLDEKSARSGEERSHFGSKNGSWMYDGFEIAECIKNRCVTWKEQTTMGIGTFFYNIRVDSRPLKLMHQFCFTYEPYDNPALRR
jgi:hypothetical protein